MADKPILKMCNIRKIFPGVIALDNVSFELLPGEVHILLGENGAGKSTLVKILSGAIKKTRGQIFLNGAELEIKNPMHAKLLGLSIIYQEFNLVPYLTAGENIFLGQEPTHKFGLIDRNKLYDSAQKILDELGVKIDAHSLVRDLGVAQQQMVEVAKSLSMAAKILIMDEPTSALTDQEITELFTTIRRLQAQGVAIIYISHRIEELFAIGDRVTVLRDGTNVGTFPISTITRSELIRLMVDRPITEHFPKQTARTEQEILRVEGLKNRVLTNIGFALYRGEILGIAGLLGAGRTELARAIFGIDKLDAGKIFINGKPQMIKSPQTAIKHGIGFLTEDRKNQGLVLNLSVKSNICLASIDKFSKLAIVNAKQENRAANRYIKHLRIITPGLNQKALYLSGGNQQKVVLAKWLCSEVNIFIFDEPTRGIDVGAKVEIYQLMNQLTASGVAIIMISSDLPEILGMSDRILVMHQGKIAGEFSCLEATQEKILHCALGR